MCFTSTASFTTAALLIAGGAVCIHKTLRSDHKYLAMAIMPVVVGIQQFAEGWVWMGAEKNDLALMNKAALFYMFFVWLFWPCWTGFMASMLESSNHKKRLLLKFSGVGLVFGLTLYLPYFWHPDWLHADVIHHSIAYHTTLLPDKIVPRWVTGLTYLFFVGFPPLLSSYAAAKRFGWLLIVFVPLTYFLFVYAYISVLCFFAALMTMYLIFIIGSDRCQDMRPVRDTIVMKTAKNKQF